MTEFPTVESSRPIDNHRHMRNVYGKDVKDVISDAESIVLTVVKRTLVTGYTVTDQLQQQGRRPKARLMG